LHTIKTAHGHLQQRIIFLPQRAQADPTDIKPTCILNELIPQHALAVRPALAANIM
jgi:hypothetical protein